jgi:hypothetical protein
MGVRRIEDPHHPRGYRELRSNGEMRKLLDRKIALQVYALSARKRSPTTATSSPTTSVLAEWEGHGETITLKTSRRFIGGATRRRDQSACDIHPGLYLLLSLRASCFLRTCVARRRCL